MSESARAVLEESRRFRRQLPELLQQIPGRWVMYKDGRVQSVHDAPGEAYAEGLRRYGLHGGFVVSQVVAETRPAPLTASLAFGLVSP